MVFRLVKLFCVSLVALLFPVVLTTFCELVCELCKAVFFWGQSWKAIGASQVHGSLFENLTGGTLGLRSCESS